MASKDQKKLLKRLKYVDQQIAEIRNQQHGKSSNYQSTTSDFTKLGDLLAERRTLVGKLDAVEVYALSLPAR